MSALKTISLAAIVIMCALAVSAQTTGTITVSGSQPAACSLTNSSDTALSSTIALGAMTPAANNTLVTGTAVTHLRSNKAYVVSAQATALSFTGAGIADGGNAMALSDIGFGLTAVDATATNVASSHTDTIVAGPPSFDYTGGWTAAANGLTPFVGGTNSTLNDITANTQVLSGTRLSKKGNIATNNNAVVATFGVATLPQYFTPNTTFSSTVTLTMTCP